MTVRVVTLKGKVIKVLASTRVVINLGGENSDVRVGDEFVLFANGDPVVDPETGENLGELEMIRGRGVVANVQPRFSVLDSSEKQRREIIEQFPAAGFGFPQRRYFEELVMDFDQVAVGDVARRVALSRRA